MKKVALLTIAALLFTGGIAVGSSINGTFQGLNIVKVSYIGKELQIQDTPAVIYNDRTVIPLYLLKQLGFDVTWNQNQYSVDIRPTEAGKPLTAADISAMDGVGLILNYNSLGVPAIQGTGVVIEGNVLLTAHHVFQGSSKMVFEDNGTTTFLTAGFDDTIADVTGVKVENDKYHQIHVSTNIPKVGDKIFTLSFPGSNRTVTEGIIQEIQNDRGTQIIRFSGAVDHGSSGGALLNAYGELVGIITNGSDNNLSNFATSVLSILPEIDKSKLMVH